MLDAEHDTKKIEQGSRGLSKNILFYRDRDPTLQRARFGFAVRNQRRRHRALNKRRKCGCVWKRCLFGSFANAFHQHTYVTVTEGPKDHRLGNWRDSEKLSVWRR